MSSEKDYISEMFEEFNQEIDKKIGRLEQEIKVLNELVKKLESETKVINVSNLQIKGSLGDTMKTVGDMAKNLGKLG
jgi:regulator of replication initiation timing